MKVTSTESKLTFSVDNLVNNPALIHTKSNKTDLPYPLFTSS